MPPGEESLDRTLGRLEAKVDLLKDTLDHHTEQEGKVWDRFETRITTIDNRIAEIWTSQEEHRLILDQARWTAMIRGNLKYLVSLSIAVSGSIVYFAVQWINWLHTKLGGTGIVPPR